MNEQFNSAPQKAKIIQQREQKVEKLKTMNNLCILSWLGGLFYLALIKDDDLSCLWKKGTSFFFLGEI